jgi:hypothetical protein
MLQSGLQKTNFGDWLLNNSPQIEFGRRHNTELDSTLVKHRNTCVVIQALFGLQEKLDIGYETHERPGHFTE